jgi:hypothetical protein
MGRAVWTDKRERTFYVTLKKLMLRQTLGNFKEIQICIIERELWHSVE